jgi:cysteine desulfurase
MSSASPTAEPFEIIDLDANASTPHAPEVLEGMVEALHDLWGNPSSENLLGTRAQAALNAAREQVAVLVGCDPREILFTSGATEAINLAILGTVGTRGRGAHVVTSAVEHKAVLKVIDHLHQSLGVAVTLLRPDPLGRIRPEQVREALREETALVCLIHGNNEIGTVNPVAEVGELLRHHPAMFLVDSAQTVGYFPPQVKRDGIDLMPMSAHKMHGPKGAGALYVRKGVPLTPVLFGGGQERGFRPGTPDLPALVGMGIAARLACEKQAERVRTVTALRNLLLGRLQAGIPDLRLNGDPEDRLPGNLSLTLPAVEVRTLQRRLPHLAMSRGSACSSETQEPSHILKAIGLADQELHWTLRIGLSSMNTTAQVERAADDLIAVVRTLRS